MLARGTYHGTHYLELALALEDGRQTVDVSDFDNATLVVRGATSAKICPTDFSVPLPALVSTLGDEICVQVDLRSVPSVDLLVEGDSPQGAFYAGTTGVDF